MAVSKMIAKFAELSAKKYWKSFQPWYGEISTIVQRMRELAVQGATERH